MLTPAQQLSKAIFIASREHEQVFDRGGNPYVLHPLRIMMRLRTQDFELMCISVLHDVFEDSKNITLDDLHKQGFSERVINALRLLTHHEDDTYDVYIEKISKNKDAIIVKLEDLRDNSDITRLKGIRDKDIERIKKYHTCYLFLKDKLKGFQ